MNPSEKIAFVNNLTDSIKNKIITKITSGAIPENWDGHELRLLLAGKFNREIPRIMKDGRSSRVKNFHSDCDQNNI